MLLEPSRLSTDTWRKVQMKSEAADSTSFSAVWMKEEETRLSERKPGKDPVQGYIQSSDWMSEAVFIGQQGGGRLVVIRLVAAKYWRSG